MLGEDLSTPKALPRQGRGMPGDAPAPTALQPGGARGGRRKWRGARPSPDAGLCVGLAGLTANLEAVSGPG